MSSFPTFLAAAVLLAASAAVSYASPPVPISGAKLKLGTQYFPRLILETKKTIGTDNTNGTSSDPVLHGGAIRVLSTVGDVFDQTYQMPASAQWRYYKHPGQNAGYDYVDSKKINGPIGVVRIRNGKLTRVIGTGLDFSLHRNPNPVTIVLTLADRRFCMTFGGVSWKFVPDTKYLSLRAPAPVPCPASPSGAFLDDAGL